jgi:hypothetical protein
VKARDGQRISNARQLGIALEQYETSYNTYKVAGAGYNDGGGGFVAKSGVAGYNASIISALKTNGYYGSNNLSDPLYGTDNYYLGLCTSTTAYTVFLKVEQAALQQSTTTIQSACDGVNAAANGFNYIAYANGGGLAWGTGGGAGGGVLNIASAATTASLPAAVYNAQTIVVGSSVYVLGGWTPSAINTIRSASTSNFTAWSTPAGTIGQTKGFAQSLIVGSYIYLFGGAQVGSTGLDTIYRAPVSDPTQWVDTGAKLPGNLLASSLVVVGDSIYLFGGRNSGGYTGIIYKAYLTDPLTWSTAGSLPFAYASGQVVLVGSTLYYYGGYTDAGPKNVIYQASVANPSSWTNTGKTLPINLSHSQSIIVGDTIYLLGGWGDGGPVSTILRASIADPSMVSIASQTLPITLSHSQVELLADGVYMFGGYSGSAATSTILKIPIQ